jgi:hypothetical protein
MPTRAWRYLYLDAQDRLLSAANRVEGLAGTFLQHFDSSSSISEGAVNICSHGVWVTSIEATQ